MIFLVIAALLLTAVLGFFVRDNFLPFSVRHESLTDRTEDRIRIVQISDLHKRRYGADNKLLCERTAAEEPDLIFITGDLVSRTEKDLTAIRATIDKLCGIAPVYMIFGNHEQSLAKKVQTELIDIVLHSEAILLRNERFSDEVKGRELMIYGIEPSYATYIKYGKYKDLDDLTADDMRKLFGEPSEKETLLLAHNPLFADVYAEWGADFTFCGHVHGGGVRIFGKGMLSPERKFFPAYAKGVYRKGKSSILVSAGLGGKIRLFNRPELVVYDI